LCDTLYYNVHQSRSRVDAQSLSFASRLAILLKRAGRVGDASRIHAQVLRDLHDIDHLDSKRDDGYLRAAADKHLDGLRSCGNAARPDAIRIARELYTHLGKHGKLSVPPVERWKMAEPVAREIAYESPSEWTLKSQDAERAAKMMKGDAVLPAKLRWGFWALDHSPSGVSVST
jgi:hypothetical protein